VTILEEAAELWFYVPLETQHVISESSWSKVAILSVNSCL